MGTWINEYQNVQDFQSTIFVGIIKICMILLSYNDAIDNWKPYQVTLKPIKHEIYDLNLHVTWRNDVAASG